MSMDRFSAEARAARLKKWDSAARPFITPSMLNCDFSKVATELDALEKAGVVAVHLDVMDGHFVPNLSYGAPVAKDWRRVTDFPFDTHLMMSDPGKYLDDFIKAGSDVLGIHIEAVPDPVPLLRKIKAAGCRASLVFNPPTSFETIEPFLDEVDTILVMSVMPGFGGQKFDASVLSKVQAIRKARPNLPISMDGGINKSTAADAVAAGATQLIVGSATFRADGNYAAALAEVAEEIRRGCQRGSAPTL
jgi:ribulose-phosphate 3-epimerase